MTGLVLYGSLRRGQPDFQRLGLDQALRYREDVKLKGRLVDLGDYPGFRPEGAQPVSAELYEIVDPSVLSALDEFEEVRPGDPRPFDPATGEGSLYLRQIVPNSSGVPAWVYVYNGSDVGVRRSVPHGDWLRWLDERGDPA